jgi:ribosomal protein L21E
MGFSAKSQAWHKWSGRLLCLGIMFTSFSLWAQPAGNHIVDEAVDASDANTLRLEIRFIMPVNYLWYFPHSQKDDFLIAIQPITGLADYDTSIREHIRIPNSLSTVIKDLYYDGTEQTGRFVVLETNQDVGISIKQGRDMKSIIIEFASLAPKPADDCNSAPKQREQSREQK